jgi:hypothetical protein
MVPLILQIAFQILPERSRAPEGFCHQDEGGWAPAHLLQQPHQGGERTLPMLAHPSKSTDY